MLLMKVQGSVAAELTRLSTSVRRFEERFVREAAEKGLQYARSYTPVRSGRLAQSLRIESHGSLEHHIIIGGNRAPYAPYVEYGTRPHTILPRRAHALRFEVKGEIIYRRRVHHPGSRPQLIMRRAAEQVLRDLDELAERLL